MFSWLTTVLGAVRQEHPTSIRRWPTPSVKPSNQPPENLYWVESRLIVAQAEGDPDADISRRNSLNNWTTDSGREADIRPLYCTA